MATTNFGATFHADQNGKSKEIGKYENNEKVYQLVIMNFVRDRIVNDCMLFVC